MHRVLSNFSRKLSNTSNSLLSQNFQHQKTFNSLAKPNYNHKKCSFSQVNPLQSFCLYQSHHTVTGKVHGFMPNPLVSKLLMSNLANTQFRVLSKKVTDCKIRLLAGHFGRGFSGFGSGFGSYGNRWSSWLYRLSPNDVVLGLILANVGVFMLWRVADGRFMVENFMISLDNFKSGRIHTLVTSAFSHVDMWHIISNMVGLYFFGTNIARTFGSEYLLKLYIAGSIGGSLFYLAHHAYMALSTKRQGMWMNDPSRTPGLGASAAVNAIMLLDIFLHPRATLYFDFIIPVPAILLGIFLIGKDLLRIMEGNSNISGSAHLGGAAVAALAYARIRKGRF
ncbi:RHOMBOID-like protein 12, mitochondrial [Mercurialis annua]|uniref:RHOMBOID-like protein 12, mitochondrial n=1 Tax=Mercurialis annua TaxID=3986 RepID=UPI00215F9B70|nr:RHOMBOID-like protein 12, mitochondrial [Mercurialis annua]